jgi:16S rRNA (guanine966-N2)-methyltransferase
MSRLRIIAGEYGGRFISADVGRATHPMGDRVRSALFNMVDVRDKRVLDVYAGTGAVGLEALSRGASHVDFVENDKKAQRVIAENIAALGVNDKAKLYKVSMNSYLEIAAKNGQKYDVVIADPPYHFFDKPDYFSTVLKFKDLVNDKGLMILSYPGRLRVPTVNGVVVVDIRSYGDAALVTFHF